MAKRRMLDSVKVRGFITNQLKFQKGKCLMCGVRLISSFGWDAMQMFYKDTEDLKIATIDHIHPVSKGGSDDFSNLQLLCRSCNSKKGGQTIWELNHHTTQ